MSGIDPDYREAIDEFVDSTIEMTFQHFGETVEHQLPQSQYTHLLHTMAAARSRIVQHFRGQLSALLETQNSQPIMSIVESLPKDELAEMAEALVNLTSLKRRVTPEAETVGGPIDVAVISKGDGLIWIKRKHYFSPELNFRYFNRDESYHNRAITGGIP